MARFLFIFSLTSLLGCGGTVGTGTGGAGGHASTGAGGSLSITSSTSGVSASSASGTSTSSSSSGGGTCPVDCAANGLTCCAGVCVNTNNDFKNCGSCGHLCLADPPYCSKGGCTDPICVTEGGICKGDCCAFDCCLPGTICCDILGPMGTVTKCVAPQNGTCPP